MLMFTLPETEAARRLETLNGILEANCRNWTGMPLTVTVSHGVAAFNSLSELGAAFEAADRAMYQRRQKTRSGGGVRGKAVFAEA